MTDRAVAWQRRCREAGVCPHCPPPREVLPINPKTGKRYTYCQVERERRRQVALERRHNKSPRR